MPPGRETEQVSNLRFSVEIDGVPFSGFCHVSGLESLVDVDKERDREPPATGRRRPRGQTFGNLVLRRGFDRRRELWQWYRSASRGRDDRRNGAIAVLDDSGEAVARIVFRGAWPCRWRLSALDALEPAVLTEEVELVVAEFEIE